jgi:hypothetical protein
MGEWMNQNSWLEGLVVEGLLSASSVITFERKKDVLM